MGADEYYPPLNKEANENHEDILIPHKKIKFAILDYWEMGLPKTVFVPVRIYRKK